MKKIYFDNAATTQIDSNVLKSMNFVMSNNYGNPSSTHSFGRESRSIIENARKSISSEFNVSANEIFFTSGGTESDNTVLISAVRDLDVKRIITTRIEHHAVLNVVEFLNKKYNVEVKYLELDKNANIDFNQLEKYLVKNNTKTLVTLMHINNEVGAITDIDRVGKVCKKYNAFFHSDTVQSIGKYKLDLSKCNVDSIVGSAHKFHGPKGIGFLYVNKNLNLKSMLIGGGQERGLRAGTESVHNILGMEKAFLNSYQNFKNDNNHILDLKKYFIKKIKKQIKGIKFNANCDDLENTSNSIINLCLPISKERSLLLDFNLDLKGIACSKGSACQSGSAKGS
ncbi:MAG: cysteine desulfurase, partial [Flavobacteriaceae bacterium]|nr:cysteine desulfurase [Flavobacteriaceae bacterium]